MLRVGGNGSGVRLVARRNVDRVTGRTEVGGARVVQVRLERALRARHLAADDRKRAVDGLVVAWAVDVSLHVLPLHDFGAAERAADQLEAAHAVVSQLRLGRVDRDAPSLRHERGRKMHDRRWRSMSSASLLTSASLQTLAASLQTSAASLPRLTHAPQ